MVSPFAVPARSTILLSNATGQAMATPGSNRFEVRSESPDAPAVFEMGLPGLEPGTKRL
jgi:hypothetical protein